MTNHRRHSRHPGRNPLLAAVVALAAALWLAVVGVAAPASAAPAQPAAVSTTQVQWDLAGLAYLPFSGIDGQYGPQTTAAVRAFQTDNCLSVDGIAGPQTDAALADKVTAVQAVAGASQDGAYGPNTKAAVASWQSAHGLTADGQAGPETMSAMGIARTGNCQPPPPPPPPSGSLVQKIIATAQQELNNSAHNHEIGGYNCNYYSTALGVGSSGQCSNGWRTEEWCADFGTWVWQAAGANISGLDPAAASFYSYGTAHGTWHTSSPHPGDAVVFNLSSDGSYASHVGLVTAVNGGSITMISGNSYDSADGQDDAVTQVNIPSSGGGISGYTDPVG